MMQREQYLESVNFIAEALSDYSDESDDIGMKICLKELSRELARNTEAFFSGTA